MGSFFIEEYLSNYLNNSDKFVIVEWDQRGKWTRTYEFSEEKEARLYCEWLTGVCKLRGVNLFHNGINIGYWEGVL